MNEVTYRFSKDLSDENTPAVRFWILFDFKFLGIEGEALSAIVFFFYNGLDPKEDLLW